MANFEKAYKRLEKFEGGYVNDPDDRGGETYKGISRRYHADSPMWIIIDNLKNNVSTKELNRLLEENTKVQELVRKIYKNDYWDIFELDDCPNQKMANEIFDDAVNRGVGGACIIASKVLGMTPVSTPTKELIYNIKHYGK